MLEYYASKYNLDKSISSGCHNYIPAYELLFEPLRNTAEDILEIGIGSIENGQMGGVIGLGYKTGNSLRCWRDYFLRARIHGIDIYEHELNEDRITTYVCDQSNSIQLDCVINTINNLLDIIIDDGSHRLEHQIFSFMHLKKYLKQGGIYVIEDIQPNSIEIFKELSFLTPEQKSDILSEYDVHYFDTRYVLNRADDFMTVFVKK